MIFERTKDYGVVREILTGKGIYDRISDDFAPPVGKFQVNKHPDIWYVLVDGPSVGLGMFCFFPENAVCWAAHACLFRGILPVSARQAGREVVQWIWENSPCQRIIASIPLCNRAAVRYAGDPQGPALIRYGVNERSFMKGGRLWDQILMGRSKCPV